MVEVEEYIITLVGPYSILHLHVSLHIIVFKLQYKASTVVQ